MCSDLHCRCIGPMSGSGFNQIGIIMFVVYKRSLAANQIE